MWTALQFGCKARLNSNWQHHKVPTQNGHPYLCYFILCPKFSFLTSSPKRPCIWYRVIHLQDKCLLISCYPIYNRHVVQSELSGLKREFSVRPRKAPSKNSSVQAESALVDAVALQQKPQPQAQGRCKSNRIIARKKTSVPSPPAGRCEHSWPCFDSKKGGIHAQETLQRESINAS